MRLLALCAVGLFFEASGVLALRSTLNGRIRTVGSGVLLSMMVLTIVGGIYFVYRLVSTRPLLVINQEGITDRSSLGGVGLLRWEEISDVEPLVVGGQPFISILTRDPDAVVARQRFALKRALLRANRRMGWGVASISANVLPVSVNQAIDSIREEMERQRGG